FGQLTGQRLYHLVQGIVRADPGPAHIDGAHTKPRGFHGCQDRDHTACGRARARHQKHCRIAHSYTSGLTTVSGTQPSSTARTARAHISAMRRRAVVVAEPACGATTTRSQLRSPGCTTGSSVNTSRP